MPSLRRSARATFATTLAVGAASAASVSAVAAFVSVAAAHSAQRSSYGSVQLAETPPPPPPQACNTAVNGVDPLRSSNANGDPACPQNGYAAWQWWSSVRPFRERVCDDEEQVEMQTIFSIIARVNTFVATWIAAHRIA